MNKKKIPRLKASQISALSAIEALSQTGEKEQVDEVLSLIDEEPEQHTVKKAEKKESVEIIDTPVILHPSSPSSDELFGRPVEQDDSVKSVAKQLFSSDVIDLKTDITHNEINDLTRLRFMQEKFKVQSTGNLDHVISSFLRLRVSKDRKSRREFIEALQTENRNQQGGSIWSKLFNGNNQQ